MLSNEALDQAYRRFRPALMKEILSKVSDPQLADELVQETFLRAHRFSHLYDGRHSVSTWLWAIAERAVIDHLRRPSSRPAEGLDPGTLACPRGHAEDLMIARHSRRESLRRL